MTAAIKLPSDQPPKDGDTFCTQTVGADTANEAVKRLPLQRPFYAGVDKFTFDEGKYQKRRPDIEKDRDRKSYHTNSQAHIDQMARQLKDDPEYHLEPISLAQYFNSEYKQFLVLVDGHHRYKAYRQAGRDLIPARQIRVPEAVAEDLAYILNQSSVTLGVSTEQKLQQTWELVLKRHVKDAEWQHGWTGNQLGKTFGGITSTVKRMVKRKDELGEEAHQLTWKQAKSAREFKQLTEHDRARMMYKTATELMNKLPMEEDINLLTNILYDIYHGRDGQDRDAYIEKIAGDIRKGNVHTMDEVENSF